MSQKLTLEQLKSFLWKAVDILDDNMGVSETKDYILRIIFIKRLSDVFEDELEKLIQYYLDEGETQEQAIDLANDYDMYGSIFFIPKTARWSFLKSLKQDIGDNLNKAAFEIENYNPDLKGVLSTIDFNTNGRVFSKKLQDLLSHLSKYRLCNKDFERPDLLGIVYESLVKMFADSAGKKGSEFYTPNEVAQLLVALLKPNGGMSAYDPAVGTGGMLIQMHNYLKANKESAASLSLYGQEMYQNTWAICKINMFLHGVENADVRIGDTLRDPKHIASGELMGFDRVISNPPFLLRNWGKEECDNDNLGRFPYGTPPKSAGDLAFVQHIIASMNNEGMAGIVVPHGVLFRGSSEMNIRQGIINDDLLEAVIGLPQGLFYGTGIPTCLLILNKKKLASHKENILFIDASNDFESTRYMNKLRKEDIALISHAFDNFKSMDTFCKLISTQEIKENNYELTIKKYVDNSDTSKEINRLLKHHSEFRRSQFNDSALVKSISILENMPSGGDKNVIYMNRIVSANQVCTSLDCYENKLKNYFEIEFEEKQLLKSYAQLYFQSKLGRLVLSHLPKGVNLPSISKENIESLEIPLPPILLQREIVRVANKLDIARQQIDEFFSILTTEPKQYKVIEDNTDTMVYNLSSMSEAKHLQHLIALGETRQMEFKQSFFANIDKIRSEDKVYKCKNTQGEVIKDIASFMNADGGTLLIGVNDKGKIIGVDLELKKLKFKKIDNYFQELGAQLESRLHKNYHQYCKLTEVEINECIIARIDCLPAPSPVFLDNEKFYVRTDTSSPPKTGESMLRYIQSHFKVPLISG